MADCIRGGRSGRNGRSNQYCRVCALCRREGEGRSVPSMRSENEVRVESYEEGINLDTSSK